MHSSCSIASFLEFDLLDLMKCLLIRDS